MGYRIKMIKDDEGLPEDIAKELAKKSLLKTDHFAAIYGKRVKGNREFFKPILVGEQELYERNKEFLKKEDSDGVLYVVYRHHLFDSKLFEIEYVDGEAYIEIDDKEVDEFLKEKLIETAQSPRLFEKHRNEILDMFENDLQKYADDLFYKQGKGEVFKDSDEDIEDNSYDIELEYDDLEITVYYQVAPARLYPVDYAHPAEYDDYDTKIEWTYEVDAGSVVDFFYENAEKFEELKDLKDKELEKYILKYYENLIEKYDKDLKNHFRAAAREQAEENWEPDEEKPDY